MDHCRDYNKQVRTKSLLLLRDLRGVQFLGARSYRGSWGLGAGGSAATGTVTEAGGTLPSTKSPESFVVGTTSRGSCVGTEAGSGGTAAGVVAGSRAARGVSGGWVAGTERGVSSEGAAT